MQGDSQVPACRGAINSARWMHGTSERPGKALMAFESPIQSGLDSGEFRELQFLACANACLICSSVNATSDSVWAAEIEHCFTATGKK